MGTSDERARLHLHRMTPLKDGRKGDCCGIKIDAVTDGEYCNKCDYFFHNTCMNPPLLIDQPSHKCGERLSFGYHFERRRCNKCGEKVIDHNIPVYRCYDCDFVIHLDCAKYPPLEVIAVPKNHGHQLKLEKVASCFTCSSCGDYGDGYSYKCHECDLTFHVNCEKYGAEVNHPSHSLHPLKLITGEPPAYTDGKCRLCGKEIFEIMFYHCSLCNFTLDLHCVFNPPPPSFHDLNTHDHSLTLMPQSISFTCTICGLHGDRSPYVCLPCNFTIHNDCSGFPWVININRHDHRVSRTSLLGLVNAVCGICRKKMDWSCGGYTCKRCPVTPVNVFHTKCATRKDVSDGIERKDEPEEEEAMEPFKVIDENTIQHFLHEEHNLRLNKSGIFVKESCKACTYPIYHYSFYSCMICSFILHESCAIMPTRKWHVVSNKRFFLSTITRDYITCDACEIIYNGFTYSSDPSKADVLASFLEKYGIEAKDLPSFAPSGLDEDEDSSFEPYGFYGEDGSFCHPSGIDVRCASVFEPFVHQSHHHPLFYTSPKGVCSACNKEASHVLRCVEDNCGYILDFKCALLPYEVKHRVDAHFLSLCYGENTSAWCDLCERRTDPKAWFYTSKDLELSLHIDCVLGDFRALETGRYLHLKNNVDIRFEIILNNSMSRPLCHICKSRCIVPIVLKRLDNIDHRNPPGVYYCSIRCTNATNSGYNMF